MEAERHQKIRRLFHEAAAREGADRRAFLRRECGDDAALLAEVERLLGAGDVPTGDLFPLAARVPEQLGRYRVEREIGRGGMGVVYAAYDPERRERVALKVVHPQLAVAPRFLDRFRREAQAGLRVEHENVVRTYAVDAAEGFHFLVLEYVEGRNLRRILEDLGTVPERLLREIALQVARGLEAIHAEGIVHRDLKPENILLTDDQRVRIMDLGVAKVTDASVDLTGEGHFIGSLAYAAPEQIHGGEVGPSADLYALGVVLYELASGENPFRHDVPGAAIRAHLDVRPAPLPELSPFFGAVVATLLEKDPPSRFASSAELRRALEEGERGAWWAERAPFARSLRRPRVDVGRETALRGRDDEMEALRAAWREAREGGGGVVLLEGEPGIGKSRLLDEFFARIEEEEPHLLYGSFPPAQGMRGLCDAILGKFGAEALEHALAPLLPRARALVPHFAAIARGETPSQPLGADVLPGLCASLLKALAAERPTVFVLDDLHFAAEEARAVALALARTAQGRRALVVLSARPGLPRLFVDGLAALPRFRRVPLARLAQRHVSELLRDVFRSVDLADRLGARIAQKSDGVPFFVFELVRGLVEGGYVRRGEDGAYAPARDDREMRVPSAIRDAIAARLDRLGAEERAVLDVAALQGYDFDAELVAAVLGRPLVRVLQDLAELERRHALVHASGRLYRFDHHQLQEVLVAEMAPRLREEYHALVADEVARRGAGDRTAYLVAWHHLRGSRPREAVPHLDGAVEYLERRYLTDRAADLVALALARPGLLDGERRLAALLGQARRLGVLFRGDAQREAAEEAVALADRLGAVPGRVRARLELGSHFFTGARSEAALAPLSEALALALEARDVGLEAVARTGLGSALWRLGRYEEASRELERAVEAAAASGDLATEARASGALGLIGIETDRLDEARSRTERFRELGGRTGDRRAQTYAEGNLGAIAWREGRLAEAREHCARALEMGMAIGDRRAEVTATGNLGLIALDLGLLADARDRFLRQLDLARELGDRESEVHARLDLALVHLVLGSRAAARELIAAGMDLARAVRAERLEAHAHLRLGWAEADDGDAAAAERGFLEALRRFRACGDRANAAGALTALGALAVRRADPAAARYLDEALAILRQLASPGTRLLAEAHRAALPDGDAAAAETAVAQLEGRATATEAIEARLLLWRKTGKPAHLAEARRRLDALLDAAPPEARAQMKTAVPLYRDVLAASVGPDGSS